MSVRRKILREIIDYVEYVKVKGEVVIIVFFFIIIFFVIAITFSP